MKKTGLATGRLDRPDVVGGGVVAKNSSLVLRNIDTPRGQRPTPKIEMQGCRGRGIHRLTRCGGGRSLFGEPLCLVLSLGVAGVAGMITRGGSECFQDFEKFCVGEGQSWSVGQQAARMWWRVARPHFEESSHRYDLRHVTLVLGLEFAPSPSI